MLNNKIINLLLIIVISISVISCGKKENHFTKVPSEIIYPLITNEIPDCLIYGLTTSSYYAVPDIKWVNTKFTPQLKYFIFKNDIRYIHETFDCDKYVGQGLAIANLLFFKEKNKPDNCALSTGEFTYYKGTELHSIMFWVVSDNSNLTIKFYEPQRQDYLNLDKYEISSCFNWEM